MFATYGADVEVNLLKKALTLFCTSVAARLTHAYHVNNGVVSNVEGGMLGDRDDNVAE